MKRFRFGPELHRDEARTRSVVSMPLEGFGCGARLAIAVGTAAGMVTLGPDAAVEHLATGSVGDSGHGGSPGGSLALRLDLLRVRQHPSVCKRAAGDGWALIIARGFYP